VDKKTLKMLVRIDPDTGCWNWTRSTRGSGGYAQVSRCDHVSRMGSHMVWEMYNQSKVEFGMCILHKCDNPRCLNPKHLRKGTKKDNTQDMLRKGRYGKHVPGRHYNTEGARKALAEKYKDPAFRALQGVKISKGLQSAS
jgi:hypothetical protein